MESLWPLLLIVVLSIVFSRNKKKPEQMPDSPHDPAPHESPWEEMMREIRQRELEAQRQAEMRDTDSAPQPTRPLQPALDPQSKPYTPLAQERQEVAPARELIAPEVPEAEPMSTYSFDDEAIQNFESEHKFTYDDDVRPTAQIAAAPRITSPDDEVPTDMKDEKPNEKLPFDDGFDPKMAVIYSEIFNRRY